MVDAMIVGIVVAPPSRPLFSELPNVFYPAPLLPEPALDLLIRFDGDADGIASAVRTIVSGMDARLPLGQIVTGEDLRWTRNASSYAVAQTISLLGVIALILAAAGLYGVVSYMVMLRQKEIGIRAALGADRQRSVPRPPPGGCSGGSGMRALAQPARSRPGARPPWLGIPMDPVAFGGAALLLVERWSWRRWHCAASGSRRSSVELLRTGNDPPRPRPGRFESLGCSLVLQNVRLDMRESPSPRLSDKERLILELLVEHGDLYGLQLVAASHRRLKRGSVYVTLSRMVEKGFVESEPGPRAPSDTGLPRPLYRPTALGKRVLRAWTALARELAWNPETA